jgi:pectinesterase
MKHLLLFLSISITGISTLQAQTSNPKQYKYVFTVAKDGTGDYQYIQDAIDAMRVFPLAPITLYIKNGVYNEKIELPATKTDVTFIGESVDKTIIVFNDYSGRGKLNTFNSFTAKIAGNRFRAENITFANSAGPVGQAVALHVESDQAIFVNCRFLGNQDTIYAGGETSRQLFVNCYIEGTTDFIFGPATAVFQNCEIRSKTNSFITAASTTQGKKFGFVFIDCKLTADTGATKVYLGRPWRNWSKAVFIRCNLGKHITPVGWDNWSNPANEQTAFYAEYKNTGEGASIANRVKWSHQLTDKEAAAYSLPTILSNEGAALPLNVKWYQESGTRTFEWPVKK